jgi:hypothetical protein
MTQYPRLCRVGSAAQLGQQLRPVGQLLLDHGAQHRLVDVPIHLIPVDAPKRWVGEPWSGRPLSDDTGHGRQGGLRHASCEDLGCALLRLRFGLLQRSRVVGWLGVVLNDELQRPGLVLARFAGCQGQGHVDPG